MATCRGCGRGAQAAGLHHRKKLLHAHLLLGAVGRVYVGLLVFVFLQVDASQGKMCRWPCVSIPLVNACVNINPLERATFCILLQFPS